MEAAKKQTSLDEKVYSLNFDGQNLTVTFKESGLQNNPVEAVKEEANKMANEMLEIVDKVEVTVNGNSVTITKENKNIEKLAKAFLGETKAEDFKNNGTVKVAFTTKISKGDVKDVEVGEVSATFAMDMDSTREANQNKLIEVAKNGVDKAIREGSLKDYFNKVTYGEDNKTAIVTIAKDSKISELPQNETKLMEALKAGIDLATIEKLELKLDDENSIEIDIKNKEIPEIKSKILNEEKIKTLLEKNLIDLKDKSFVLKASGEKLGEVEYTIKFDITEITNQEKASFHENAVEQSQKLVKNSKGFIDSIDYKNGEATVKLNVDKLEDVNDIKNLGTGLFSEILPELGVKSVTIGNEKFTVDPNSIEFNLEGMVKTVQENINEQNVIEYSAIIEKNGVTFEEKFKVKFELLGSKETKVTNTKNTFLEEAKKQKSLNEKVYTLDFNGENLKVTFKESGLQNNPVKVVKEEANKMADEMLKIVDKVEVTVNGHSVIITKENKNIEELAKAFLGETKAEDFKNNGTVKVAFTTKISKGDIKDVEIGNLKAMFNVDKDITNKEEIEKIISIEDEHMLDVIKNCNDQAKIAKFDAFYSYEKDKREYIIKIGEKEKDKYVISRGIGLATGLIEPVTMGKKTSGLTFAFGKYVDELPENLESINVRFGDKSININAKNIQINDFSNLGFGMSDKMEKIMGTNYIIERNYKLEDGTVSSIKMTMKIEEKN